jgi:exodeoxyribonuclease V beta subunit
MKHIEASSWKADPETPVAPPLGEDELPGGAASGLFLHEVLEKLDFAHLEAPLEAFGRQAEVRALVEAALRRHDREPRHLQEGLRLVYTTLTAPVRLGERQLPRGFRAVDKSLREMEFVYPFRGGFIKGIVDFLFEQDGLAYFVDWKSDRLAGWDAPALRRHVDEHYRLQAKLYALAMVKLLGVGDEAAYERRFGGLAYCFLRGMPDAVHFERPAWRDIQAWQTELGT